MPKWTPDQQTAIDDRGGALLVSAAAGSGKTAVLTERVLRRLTDENDPVDIDRLLLVTFTNAAAAEMRERIGAALGAAVAANPRDTRLRRQLFLVHRAKITTVHALCLSLAREQAAVLGIAPDFRLMDENEGKLLRAEVLEEVLDTAYEQANEKFFRALRPADGGARRLKSWARSFSEPTRRFRRIPIRGRSLRTCVRGCTRAAWTRRTAVFCASRQGRRHSTVRHFCAWLWMN